MRPAATAGPAKPPPMGVRHFGVSAAEAKRSTFVIPRRDGNDIDTVGYLFTGLLHHQDARLWYRAKFGYEQAEQQSDDDAYGQA